MSSGVIRKLDDLVVDQIAAGEVIERPSSVVKELVENSIDAGADSVSVAITEGGISLIEVLDTGRGMNKEDLLLSTERFATSKLKIAQDLDSIATYGFRGEALSSIASVSELSIDSRPKDEEVGLHLRAIHGSTPEVTQAPMPVGTRVRVRNLFSNIPARKEFLKKPQTEAQQIKNVLIDFSLARTDIRFRLSIDGKEVLNVPAQDSLGARLKSAKLLKGKHIEVAEDIEIPVDDGTVYTGKIEACLSEPLFSMRSSAKLRTLVNGRIVKNPMLLRATKDAYGNMLKPGMYPTGVVKVEIHPKIVDVNVHPQKLEVRFRSESKLYVLVKRAVEKGLSRTSSEVHSDLTYSLKPKGKIDQENAAKEQVFFFGESASISSDANGIATNVSSQSMYSVRPDVATVPELSQDTTIAKTNTYQSEISELSNVDVEQYKYLGQIFKLYLLFASDSRLAVVDMHAADERINFYKLKKQFATTGISFQKLLLPLQIPLSDFDALEDDVSKLLLELGFEAESKNDTLFIHSLPERFSQSDAEDIVRDAFASGWQAGLDGFENKLDYYIARMSCHKSLRRGNQLTKDEAYALLASLKEVELSGWCPHGRPVVCFYEETDLEKRFGRIYCS